MGKNIVNKLSRKSKSTSKRVFLKEHKQPMKLKNIKEFTTEHSKNFLTNRKKLNRNTKRDVYIYIYIYIQKWQQSNDELRLM